MRWSDLPANVQVHILRLACHRVYRRRDLARCRDNSVGTCQQVIFEHYMIQYWRRPHLFPLLWHWNKVDQYKKVCNSWKKLIGLLSQEAYWDEFRYQWIYLNCAAETDPVFAEMWHQAYTGKQL